MLPFGGTFDLVQLKGSTLKKAFEHSVHRYGQSTGEFLQVGGKWHILQGTLSLKVRPSHLPAHPFYGWAALDFLPVNRIFQ